MDKNDRLPPAVTLAQFWDGVTQGTLVGSDGLTLAYCYIRHPESSRAIVICNGRVESYLKYQETIYDLYQLGYSIYSYDHPGQGLSSRLTTNPQQGHIDQFERYVVHLQQFVAQIVLPQCHPRLYLLAHSMGGAIATLYLARHSHLFAAAVMCAPMYGIRLPLPKSWVMGLASRMNTNHCGKEPNYIPFGHDYQASGFRGNPLTHSEQRYQRLLALYQATPQIRLGSPTNQWLLQSLAASEQARIAAANAQIPLLILQAEKDSIVANGAQRHALGPNTTLQVIAGAKHELLIEADCYRQVALHAIVKFFSLHC